MYEDPLPTVVTYWVANTNTDREQLFNEYADFQIQTRLTNARLFGDLSLSGNPLNEHPITYLRTRASLNLTEVAKRLCLSQSTLFYFERNPIVQQIVPVQLIHALHDADYTEDETTSLENAYAIYRSYKLKQQNIKVTSRPSLSAKDELTASFEAGNFPPVGHATNHLENGAS